MAFQGWSCLEGFRAGVVQTAFREGLDTLGLWAGLFKGLSGLDLSLASGPDLSLLSRPDLSLSFAAGLDWELIKQSSYS